MGVCSWRGGEVTLAAAGAAPVSFRAGLDRCGVAWHGMPGARQLPTMLLVAGAEGLVGSWPLTWVPAGMAALLQVLTLDEYEQQKKDKAANGN